MAAKRAWQYPLPCMHSVLLRSQPLVISSCYRTQGLMVRLSMLLSICFTVMMRCCHRPTTAGGGGEGAATFLTIFTCATLTCGCEWP